MYTPLHCIALRSIPHTDNTSLLCAWCREAGRVTIAFPAGNSREARRRRALTPPMALFEGCADLHDSRSIIHIRDISPSAESVALALPDVTRAMMATFLGETLDMLLRRCVPDDDLSNYIFDAAHRLSSLRGGSLANFHILFLFGLTKPIGIAPDMSTYRSGSIFDMRNGIFRPTQPLHHDFLSAAEASVIPILARLSYDTMQRMHLSREQRRAILDAIFDYYGIHLGTAAVVKSLAVLEQTLT